MKTRLFQTAACAAVLLAIAGSASAADTRPNVLFINIDDLRDVAAFDPCVKTPNLDRLSRMGMRFERAYVQATFCNPSRTSFLTGLRPEQTGVLDNRTHFRDHLPDVVTLPQLFRENGYYAYRLGKIYHGAESMDDPKSWDRAEYPAITPAGREGQRWYPPNREPRWCWSLAAEGDDEDQPDGQIAARAVEFLRAEHDRPFFLAVGFHKPHDPFIAPKKYFDLYPTEDLALHATPAGASPTPPGQIGGGWKAAFDRFSDDDRRSFLQAYYAATTFMDAQLGRVLDALEEQGLVGQTIIVALSDHGYHLGERDWWNKSTLYEYSARSPLWIYAPGMEAGGTPCAQPVEFVDIYPTLADLTRLEAPDHLAGLSIADLLDNPASVSPRAGHTTLRRGQDLVRSVRTSRWRYSELQDGACELFDHESDPGEWRNLAEQNELQQTVRKLQTMLGGDSEP